MRARVPQDVDLEDKLLYGLTPVRFGYLVIAGLAAVMVWNLGVLPILVRAPGCLLLGGFGALLAWGRWRGRPIDRFSADAALYLCNNYRPNVWRRRRRKVRPLVPLTLVAINQLAPPAEPEVRRA
jgi:hypothetical protein